MLTEIQLIVAFFGKIYQLTQPFPKYGMLSLYHTVTRFVKRFLENFYDNFFNPVFVYDSCS